MSSNWARASIERRRVEPHAVELRVRRERPPERHPRHLRAAGRPASRPCRRRTRGRTARCYSSSPRSGAWPARPAPSPASAPGSGRASRSPRPSPRGCTCRGTCAGPAEEVVRDLVLLLQGGVVELALRVGDQQLVELIERADAVALLVVRLGQQEEPAIPVRRGAVALHPRHDHRLGVTGLLLLQQALSPVERGVLDRLALRRRRPRRPRKRPLAAPGVIPRPGLHCQRRRRARRQHTDNQDGALHRMRAGL